MPAPVRTAPALDRATLGRLVASVGGEREVVQELVRSYLDEAPGLLARLEAGLRRQDAAEVHDAAHQLKSTSASFGAAGLAALCRELELQAAAGDLTDAPEKLASILALFGGVRASLEAEFGNP